MLAWIANACYCLHIYSSFQDFRILHETILASSPSGLQVVKRRTISDIGIDDEEPVSGRKRPVRERLGNTVVDSDLYGSQQSNKRYLSLIYQYSLFAETSVVMF